MNETDYKYSVSLDILTEDHEWGDIARRDVHTTGNVSFMLRNVEDDKVFYDEDASRSEKREWYKDNKAYNEKIDAYVNEVMNDFGQVIDLAHGYPLDATETQRVVDLLINLGTPAAKAIDPPA